MTLGRIVLMACLVGVGAVKPAYAQTPRATGPFAGLFGGQSTATQELGLRGSLFGAYQETLLPPDLEPGTLDPRFEATSRFAGASAALSYQLVRSGEGSSVFIGGQGSVSKSTLLPDVYPYQLGVSGGASTDLTSRIGLTIGADASYTPYYSFAPMQGTFSPESGFAVDPSLIGQSFGFAAIDQAAVGYGGTLGATMDLTRRTSLSAGGDYRETRLLASPLGAIRYFGGQILLRRQLTRGLGLRAGYGRQVSESEVPGAEALANDAIDAGVDYGGSFSLGRRTSVAFASSTAVVRTDDESRFRVNGNVRVSHGIGRTWSASASYVRDVELLPGFSEPLLSDNVTGQFGGLLAARVSWSSGVSWQRRQIGFDSQDYFNSYSATTGLQVGLVGSLGLYAQYGYFAYNVPGGFSTLPLVSEFSRQTVSVGVSAFVPVFSTGRASRDSR